MELYAGLDLHSRNTYIGLMDEAFNRVFKKRVPNDLEQILHILNPFQNSEAISHLNQFSLLVQIN
jgi:hypothetical protein